MFMPSAISILMFAIPSLFCPARVTDTPPTNDKKKIILQIKKSFNPFPAMNRSNPIANECLSIPVGGSHNEQTKIISGNRELQLAMKADGFEPQAAPLRPPALTGIEPRVGPKLELDRIDLGAINPYPPEVFGGDAVG
jgi:hypothetical protein